MEKRGDVAPDLTLALARPGSETRFVVGSLGRRPAAKGPFVAPAAGGVEILPELDESSPAARVLYELVAVDVVVLDQVLMR